MVGFGNGAKWVLMATGESKMYVGALGSFQKGLLVTEHITLGLKLRFLVLATVP